VTPPNDPTTSDNSTGSTLKTAAWFYSLSKRLQALQDLQLDTAQTYLETLIRGGDQLAAYVESLEVEVKHYTQGARDHVDRITASKHYLIIFY
jgi:hypothetical protein